MNQQRKRLKNREKQEERRMKWTKILFFFVFSSFILSILYVIVVLLTIPAGESEASYSGRHRSDYVLMLLQCLLGVAALFLPSILSRRWKVIVPSGMIFGYVVFLYCAIFLGEVRSFYYLVPYWDVILHCFSGMMLGALGFSIVYILNNEQNVKVNLSPAFVTLFSFCFAMMIGVLWEIYEFTGDGLFGLNMQKFMLEDGTPLVGRAALSDTMKDLIVDSCGAGISCLAGYVSLRYRRGWLQRFMLSKKSEENS